MARPGPFALAAISAARAAERGEWRRARAGLLSLSRVIGSEDEGDARPALTPWRKI